MEKLTFDDVREMLGRATLKTSRAGEITNVIVDSRQAKPGSLFFALKGKRRDGHEFVSSAVRKGASGVVVEREVKLPKAAAVFTVDNALRALGQMAHNYLKRVGCKVIAITGSNGKTTTKEMLYHILRGKFSVVRSERSFNTEIGVPLTIFQTKQGVEYCILEMGTNARGEIARLVRIAPPWIGVVTNISRTHLEGLLDIHGVARAKGELLDQMTSDGIAILNQDDHWCHVLAKHTKARKVWFGVEKDCDVFPTDFSYTAAGVNFMLNGEHPVKLRMPGGHNVGNALAAAAVAMQLGVDAEYITQRLSLSKLPEMRMERISVGGVTLINDAYNANEASVAVAAGYMNGLKIKGDRTFVIGDMLELGAESGRAHRNVGGLLGGSSIDHIVTVGAEAAEAAHEARRVRRGSHSVSSYTTLSGAARHLIANVKKGDVILFKASRGMEFEKLIEEVKEHLTPKKKKRRKHA